MTVLPATLSYDAVLFDMDGLLLDSEPLWAKVTHEVCVARGAAYDEDDVVACTGRGVDLTARYLIEKKGFRDTEQALMDAIVSGMHAAFPTCAEHDFAGDLIRAAKARGPIALGTSTQRSLVEAGLASRGLLRLFDVVVTGSDVARRKPAPDIYLAAAKRLGVAIERCVVLEDSLPGAQAGRAAGATVIAVGPSHREELSAFAHHQVPSLRHAAVRLGLPFPSSGPSAGTPEADV